MGNLQFASPYEVMRTKEVITIKIMGGTEMKSAKKGRKQGRAHAI